MGLGSRSEGKGTIWRKKLLCQVLAYFIEPIAPSMCLSSYQQTPCTGTSCCIVDMDGFWKLSYDTYPCRYSLMLMGYKGSEGIASDEQHKLYVQSSYVIVTLFSKM